MIGSTAFEHSGGTFIHYPGLLQTLYYIVYWYSSSHIMKFKNNGWSIPAHCIQGRGRKPLRNWWVHTFSMEILTSWISEPVLPADWILYQCVLFGTPLKAVWDLSVKRANWLKRDDTWMLDVKQSSHNVKDSADVRNKPRWCAAVKAYHRRNVITWMFSVWTFIIVIS